MAFTKLPISEETWTCKLLLHQYLRHLVGLRTDRLLRPHLLRLLHLMRQAANHLLRHQALLLYHLEGLLITHLFYPPIFHLRFHLIFQAYPPIFHLRFHLIFQATCSLMPRRIFHLQGQAILLIFQVTFLRTFHHHSRHKSYQALLH
jgi:hypothetical protein